MLTVHTEHAVGSKIQKLVFTIGASQELTVNVTGATGDDQDFLFSVVFGDTPAADSQGPHTGHITLPEGRAIPVQVKAYDATKCGYGFQQFLTASKGDYAIVVGVDDVPRAGARTLNFARDDAIAVARHLIDRMQLIPAHIYLLLDGNQQGTNEPLPNGVAPHPIHLPKDISEAFTNIGSTMEPSARLYFYFSGHAMVDRHQKGDSYFLMLPDSETTVGAETTRYAWSNLVSDLRRIQRKSVVIIDACDSPGPGAVNVAFASGSNQPTPGANGKWLAAPFYGEAPDKSLPDTVWARIESSQNGPSWEFGAPLNHGLLTYFLLKITDMQGAPTKALTLHDALGREGTGMAWDMVRNYVDKDPSDPSKQFQPNQKPIAWFNTPAEGWPW